LANVPAAKTWEALLSLEEIGLEDVFKKAACQLAAHQAASEPRTPVEGKEPEPIDVSEPLDLYEAIRRGEKPGWWPAKIPRFVVRVKFEAERMTPDTKQSPPIDPSAMADLGLKAFIASVRQIADGTGTPFSGSVKIEILTADSAKLWLGGTRRDVYVGEKMKGGKGGGGDGIGDAHNEYLVEQLKSRDDVLLKLYNGAAANLHGAAAVINASRGVNMAPPHMQGGPGDEGKPFWQELLMQAASIAGPLLGGAPGAAMQAGAAMMTQPVRGGPQRPYAPGPRLLEMHPAHAQMVDPGGPPPDDNVVGDYDGYYMDQSDIVQDDPYGGGNEGTDFIEDDDAGEGGGGGGGGNPLAGMSPDEAAAFIEQWMGTQNPADVKRVGMRLASKVMGS
jgi:hypothetical protein